MSGGIIGDVSNEKFELPNKYIIFIEYGMVDLDGSIRGIKNKFLQIFLNFLKIRLFFRRLNCI